LCGVRGSTPAPGPEFNRVGGHTSCVAVESGDRWLVLDAGTGFRRLADHLDGGPLRGSILLTHLHWDHTQGLPFLPNADRPDAEVDLYLPRQPDDDDAARVLGRAMSPPHFPIDVLGLGGRWTCSSLDPGRHEIEGLTVTAAEITHKGGRTFGYRVEDGDSKVAYLPDHSPAVASTARRDAALELARDVDVLLHDSQFVGSERGLADAYGHSTIEDAVAFATEARARRLVLFHHAPSRTDDEIEGPIRDAVHAASIEVTIGRDGAVMVTGSGVEGVSAPPIVHR
jgi:phosphoribosyl 1,2-cyclic phosphodiesterase